jgi:hypothetical protein
MTGSSISSLMEQKAHSKRDPRWKRLVLPMAAVVLLGGTCLLVFSDARVVAVIVAALTIVVVVMGFRRDPQDSKESPPADRAGLLRGAWEMLLYLSPIAMLTVAYPVASHRLHGTQIGGIPLTTLLLASSVTVPWLTQAVSLPLYRAIGPYVASGQFDKITERLCEVWPTTFLQCLPVVVLFVVPVELARHWSATALGTYVGLCVLYIAFAQSLILSIVYRRRGLWAVGWAGLTVALLVAPSLWFLPPLVGLATQVVPLRHRWSSFTHPVRLGVAPVAQDVLRGLLMGAVLWSDKYLLFLKAGGHFAVTSVYIALLPAVLAFNYYFVRLAPTFDASIIELRRAMEDDTYDVLAEQSRLVYRLVIRSLSRSAAVGSVIAFFVTWFLTAHNPASVPLVAAIAVASWLAMMLTLFCYKLDYIGQRGPAQRFSAIYLVGCIAAFVLLPVGPAPFVALIAFDVALVTVALRSTLVHWRSPEYSLFWRYAMAW